MGDYKLENLNERDFEHMTQAIAKKAIAVGVKPFGDGPDGGREATYEGKTQFPSVEDAWDGYILIQSKFRKKPANTPSVNATWFIEQIKADLDKFLDVKKGLKKPEYYLAVTNVVLSPKNESGGYDKSVKELTSYADKLDLKGFDVWHYDEMCRFLDTYSDVRQSYAQFITTGDIIQKLDKAIDGMPNNFQLSHMSRLTELFKEEQANNITTQEIIPKLQHYNSVVDIDSKVVGLEEKLRLGGFESDIVTAQVMKEMCAKKLTEFQFSPSAQKVFCILLAEIYTKFIFNVSPVLETAEKHEVMSIIETRVIGPVQDILGENVLEIYSDELVGMLYFLTGNCHLKWTT